MSTFINYLIESSAGLILFYALYHFLLRSETDFRAGRVYLLLSMACSLLFPLLSIAPETGNAIIPSMSHMLPELTVGDTASVSFMEKGTGNFSMISILMGIYFSVTGLLFLRILFYVGKIIFLSKKNASYRQGRYTVIETNHPLPSFSFFHIIVIGQRDKLTVSEKDLILQHELAHSRSFHSFDILFTSLLSAIFWFNPMAWQYKKALFQLHEFEADAQSLAHSSVDEYCHLMTRMALLNAGFTMAHHFNQSLTLKRIEMMKTLKHQLSRWKVGLLAMFIPLFFIAVACQDQLEDKVADVRNSEQELNELPQKVQSEFMRLKNAFPGSEFVFLQLNEEGSKALQKLIEMSEGTDKIIRPTIIESQDASDPYAIIEIAQRTDPADEEVFVIVEESAEPEGGMNALYQPLSAEIRYPQEARNKNISGKVYIEFTVGKNGVASDYKVVKGIGGGCDEEALRALQITMVNWKPGRQRGKTVNQRMVLPILFSLPQGAASIDLLKAETVTQEMDISLSVNAGIVSGKVTTTDGEPLPGVNVVIAGTTKGTVTDLDGTFSIQPSSNTDNLVFSFVGYATKKKTF